MALIMAALLAAGVSHALELRVSGLNFNAFPPHRWYNRCEHQWQGSNILLIEKIFKAKGVTISYQPPIKREEIDSNTLRQDMINGKFDAIPLSIKLPYESILYSTTPVSEVEMSLFYPRALGTTDILEKLKTLKGIYPVFLDYSEGVAVIQDYVSRHQLNVTRIDEHELNQYLNSTEHYVIRHKYAVIFDRSKWHKLNTGIILDRFYFAVADRSPWRELMPEINAAIAEANTSGYITFLEQAALQQWINLNKTAPECIVFFD